MTELNHIEFFHAHETRLKGLSKGSLIGLTSSRTSMQHSLTPTSGPPSTSSLQCSCPLRSFFYSILMPVLLFLLDFLLSYLKHQFNGLIRKIMNLAFSNKYLALPSLSFESRPPLAPERPKCNSILHLFGEWLFEAAHIGGDAWIHHNKSKI